MNAKSKAFLNAGVMLVVLAGCAELQQDLGLDRAPDEAEAAISVALEDAAVAAQSAHDYQGAASHYQRLAAREPEAIAPVLGMARNLRYAGAPKDAIRVLKKALLVRGEQPELVLELAKAQFAAALINDARESLDKAQALMPENWQVYSVRGVLYDRLGEFENAHAAYLKALELSPDNVMVLNNLSLSLAQTGALDDAIATLDKVVRSENATAQSRQNLALLYGLKGDYEKAERLAAQDLPPDMATENLTTFRLLHE